MFSINDSAFFVRNPGIIFYGILLKTNQNQDPSLISRFAQFSSFFVTITTIIVFVFLRDDPNNALT